MAPLRNSWNKTKESSLATAKCYVAVAENAIPWERCGYLLYSGGKSLDCWSN